MAAELALTARLADQGILDRFESRAIEWAEKAGIRWVELGGELWTLVSELERKKGVEPGDFRKNVELEEAPSVLETQPPGALQRLLQVPGVRRATIPTAFSVEGGYALSCGGPGAKAGITAMVRQQIPEWALAGYTLVNVPLALSYLMHGRTEVAKATRDLTIGTTVDVGKAAAARENAPAAVIQLSADVHPEIVRLMQMFAVAAGESAAAKTIATSADQKASTAISEARRATKLAELALSARSSRSKRPTDRTRELLFSTWRRHYEGICPCCHAPVDEKNLQVDHWVSKDQAEHNHLWVICAGCNIRLGLPEMDGGNKRTDQDRRRFTAFQELKGLPDVVQGSLGISIPDGPNLPPTTPTK